MAISNTVRARLNDAWLRVFEALRCRDKRSRQDFAPEVLMQGLIARGVTVAQNGEPILPGVEPPRCATNVITVTPEVDLARIHINVRQYTRFKHLSRMIPDCALDVDKSMNKRDLLYPLSRRSDVMTWLKSCPTGGRKKSGEGAELESEEKSESKRGPYKTARKKAISGAVAVLKEENRQIFIRELYDLMKERGCTPNDVSARDDVTRYIKESPLFEFESFNELVSLAKESSPQEGILRAMEANPPVIEEEPHPVQDPTAVTEDATQSKPKKASFFPDWAEG